jgi:hypothetical protein
MWIVAGASEDLCFEFHYRHDLVTTEVVPALAQVLDRPEWPLLAPTRIGPGGLLEIPD